MSSVSTLGNNPLSLLWALQQRFANGATGTDTTQATSPATPDTSTAASNASSPSGSASNTNGVTGATTPNLASNVMFIFISMQEQQSAATGSGSQSTATDPSDAAHNLFNSIDTDGDGQISQSELQAAVTAAGGSTDQANALFAKLSGDAGSVTESQLASALQQAGGHHRHHHHGDAGGASGAGGSDPLANLLSGATADGATSQQATNPDGSTVTTLTYPDGTVVTMTTPAASGTGSSAGGSATGASDGSSTSSGTDSAAVGTDPTGGQNQQDMEQMLTTLIHLQRAMEQPPRLTGLAA